MLRIFGYCLLCGDSFSPSKFETETGLRLRAKVESQQVGTSGKYRGLPVPFGSGIIDFEQKDSSEALAVDSTIVDLLTNKRDLLSALGVSDISIHFNVEYRGQCNLGLTPESLVRLAKLDVPVGITCYENKQ